MSTEVPQHHGALVEDLAESFDSQRNIVYMEPRMGSAQMENGVPIPDVFVMNKSYVNPNIRIYEVKSVLSDLQGDLRRQKWENYLPYCDRVYFALGPNVGPKGVELLKEQPVGVLVRGPKGWKTIQQCTRRERKPLSEWVLVSLLMNGKRPKAHLEDSRVNRLEYTRESLLKQEIKELMYKSWGKMSQMAKDLERRERNVKEMEKNAREAVMREIRKSLDASGYSYRDTPEKILSDAIFGPLEVVFRDTVDKLRKELLGEQQDA